MYSEVADGWRRKQLCSRSSVCHWGVDVVADHLRTTKLPFCRRLAVACLTSLSWRQQPCTQRSTLNVLQQRQADKSSTDVSWRRGVVTDQAYDQWDEASDVQTTERTELVPAPILPERHTRLFAHSSYVWLQVKVHGRVLDWGLRSTPALCVTHSAAAVQVHGLWHYLNLMPFWLLAYLLPLFGLG